MFPVLSWRQRGFRTCGFSTDRVVLTLLLDKLSASVTDGGGGVGSGCLFRHVVPRTLLPFPIGCLSTRICFQPRASMLQFCTRDGISNSHLSHLYQNLGCEKFGKIHLQISTESRVCKPSSSWITCSQTSAEWTSGSRRLPHFCPQTVESGPPPGGFRPVLMDLKLNLAHVRPASFRDAKSWSVFVSGLAQSLWAHFSGPVVYRGAKAKWALWFAWSRGTRFHVFSEERGPWPVWCSFIWRDEVKAHISKMVAHSVLPSVRVQPGSSQPPQGHETRKQMSFCWVKCRGPLSAARPAQLRTFTRKKKEVFASKMLPKRSQPGKPENWRSWVMGRCGFCDYSPCFCVCLKVSIIKSKYFKAFLT